MHDSVLSIWHRMTLCNLCWSMWHKLGAMCMYLLEEMSKSDNLDFVWSIKLALLFKTIWPLLQCSWEKNWKQGNTLVSARLKWRRRERRLVWRFNPPQCGGVECHLNPQSNLGSDRQTCTGNIELPLCLVIELDMFFLRTCLDHFKLQSQSINDHCNLLESHLRAM